MSLPGAVVTRLEAVTAVTDLVSTRIYPRGDLPQDPTLPAITYQIIDDIPEHAMGSDVGIAAARVQVDCWGSNYDEARSVATEVHGALSRFTGTSDGTVIQATYAQNKGTDGYEDVPGEHRIVQDFMIHYEE